MGDWEPCTHRLVPGLDAVFALPFCPGAGGDAAINSSLVSSRCAFFAVLPVDSGSMILSIIALIASLSFNLRSSG